MRRLDDIKPSIMHDEKLPILIGAYLDGLEPSDITIECLVGKEIDGEFIKHDRQELEYVEEKDGEHHFKLDLVPHQPGLNCYKLRMYPDHELLAHPYETGCMIWL
jgi:starch phosphorylase